MRSPISLCRCMNHCSSAFSGPDLSRIDSGDPYLADVVQLGTQTREADVGGREAEDDGGAGRELRDLGEMLDEGLVLGRQQLQERVLDVGAEAHAGGALVGASTQAALDARDVLIDGGALVDPVHGLGIGALHPGDIRPSARLAYLFTTIATPTPGGVGVPLYGCYAAAARKAGIMLKPVWGVVLMPVFARAQAGARARAGRRYRVVEDSGRRPAFAKLLACVVYDIYRK